MRFSKLLTKSVLLLSTQGLIASPQHDLQEIHTSHVPLPEETAPCNVLNTPFFSYDDVLDLLEKIESGTVEEHCTSEEIDRINQFIAFLAQQGVLPGDIEQEIALNQSIENLLCPSENCYSFYTPGEYSIIPAVFYWRSNPILCRSWFKKRWDETREFVNNHKKEIIIGAIVVIAAAAVVVTVVAVSSAGAAAVGAAEAVGAAAVSGFDKKEKSSSGSSVGTGTPPPPPIATSPDTSGLKTAMDEQILTFKETIVKEQLLQPVHSPFPYERLSLEENGRALGSLFAPVSYTHLVKSLKQLPL